MSCNSPGDTRYNDIEKVESKELAQAQPRGLQENRSRDRVNEKQLSLSTRSLGCTISGLLVLVEINPSWECCDKTFYRLTSTCPNFHGNVKIILKTFFLELGRPWTLPTPIATPLPARGIRPDVNTALVVGRDYRLMRQFHGRVRTTAA